MHLPKLKVDWFLVGIAAAMALAWVAPGPGAEGGWLHPELLTKLGVALIFFLHGLGLSTAALRAGAANWRLHLVVQGATFVAFPLLTVGLVALAGGVLSHDLKLGFYYLGALPSTVSSSVAMTAAARGNVAAAIFNATLSSLLGVVATPAWVGWMMAEPAGPNPCRWGRWSSTSSSGWSSRSSSGRRPAPGWAAGRRGTSGRRRGSTAGRSSSWSTRRSATPSGRASGPSRGRT